jgi:hypothetical protein
MSGPLGNKQINKNPIPPIDKKEYIRLDSNNRIPDIPDPRLFASFLTRDYNVTDEEKESAKNIIIELIKDTFVNKSTLHNYALKTDLQNYQPKGNYVIQDELKNYAFKKELQNYQIKGDYITPIELAKYQLKGDYQPKGDYLTQTEAAIKYQSKGDYALVSDLSRYQLNTPATPVQNPVILPVTNTQTSIPVPEQAKIQEPIISTTGMKM